jgi:thiamine transporter
MDSGRVRLYAHIGVAVALAVVLGFIRLYRLPFGGSLSLKILPLLILALYRGPRAGMIGGGLTGLITLLLDPVILHPAQVALDYFLPYLATGVVGWFPSWPRTGVAVAGLMRMASHTLSGVVYFAVYAPPELNRQTYRILNDYTGMTLPMLLQDWVTPWLYSLFYNGSVVIPETALMAVIVPVLMKKLPKS